MLSKRLKRLLKSTPATVGLIKYLEELEAKIGDSDSQESLISSLQSQFINKELDNAPTIEMEVEFEDSTKTYIIVGEEQVEEEGE